MAVEAGKKYMILKWFGAGLLFVALLLTGLTLYLGTKLKPIVRKELQEFVLKTTDSLYHIEFSSVSVNVLTGISSLSDVSIVPDTMVYNRMIVTKHAPNNLYHIKLKKLAIRHFHPWRLWRHKRLNVELLLFDNPCVVMTNRQFDFNDVQQPNPKKSPYDYISKFLKELRIHTIDFKNVSFKYINNNNPGKPDIDSIANLNITLKDWLIDSQSDTDSSRIYLLKDVVINLNNYNYATSDSLYNIRLNQLDFAASSGKLNIKSFNVEPRYSEREFGNILGYAKDRYSIQMSDIDLTGINLRLYILKKELFAKEMNIANGSLAVVNNNTLPKKIENKTGQYPHQQLQNAKNKLSIEKLNLKNIDISYAEFDKEGKHKGIITFERTFGTISNVTNVEKAKAKNHFMEADLTSYVMGSGKLDVDFKFDLRAKDGAFSYSGALVDMEGRALNRITKPLGMVKVNSGHFDKLAFDIQANDRLATGKVSFAYRDLSVALMKKMKGEDRLVKQGLISFLANALIINSDNPNAQGVFITAPVARKRVETASFFNFIWKTLFDGVKYSVGLTPQKEREIKAKIAKFERLKADRQERIKRREKRSMSRH
ncbi:hypothetical protein [Pedobacter nyackensis]|uniref:hypothetical protein n=1 Tax=Pedobacter nyackensis TaxID=475255 RepID=UPI00292F0E21|nr:hypothetical protein [Pedobacter nyackensis]